MIITKSFLNRISQLENDIADVKESKNRLNDQIESQRKQIEDLVMLYLVKL